MCNRLKKQKLQSNSFDHSLSRTLREVFNKNKKKHKDSGLTPKTKGKPKIDSKNVGNKFRNLTGKQKRKFHRQTAKGY
jgi:hypothetical protein